MQSSNIPTRFPIPFANNAGGGYIRAVPQAHQAASGTDAPASLYDGFPPETFTPVGSGGVPPSGKDMNGLLNQVTAWARWQAAGGAPMFDSTFSTAIGGYPKYALLASTTAGKLWQSTAENNTTDPDGGSPSGWLALVSGRLEQDGSVSATLTSGSSYSVTFPTAFPSACTSVQLTGINASASSNRDNWPQIIGFSASGFTYVIQGSNTGGDNTLDGICWNARGN